MKDNNIGEYIDTLVKTQGIAVVTVSDGWVFALSKDKLKQLLSSMESDGREMAVIQVQNSALKTKN